MERAVVVDLVLTVAFVGFAAYFLTLGQPIVAGVWALVAVAFGARAAGVLPH